MAAGYKQPVNYRSAASRTPVPEPFDIVGGVALLAEAPADPGDASTPMVVTVNGSPRTRVTATPNAGEFMVRTATSPQGTALLPVLEFHASDEGLPGTADYYRTGTVYTAEWFAYLLSFVTPLTGIASKAALDAAYPATADLTQPGRPGRMAFLADFTAWYSDGAAWRQISGTAPVVTAVDALYAATFGVTPDAIASHVGAMAAAFTSGMAADGAWSPPGSLTGAFQAAFTAAAQLDAAWVGGGLAGALADTFTSNASLDATWAAAGGTDILPVGTGAVVSVASGSLSVPLPSGIQAGDLLVIVAAEGIGVPPSAPSGWTRKITGGMALYYTRATGSDSAPLLASNGSRQTATMAAFRNCVTSGDPFEVASALTDVSARTTSPASVTTATDKDMVLLAAAFDESDSYGETTPTVSWGAPTGPATTEIKKGTATPGIAAQGVGLWYGVKTPAGATGSATVTYSGNTDTPIMNAAVLALKHA